MVIRWRETPIQPDPYKMITLFRLSHLMRFVRNIETISLESLCNLRYALFSLKIMNHISPRDLDLYEKINKEIERRVDEGRRELAEKQAANAAVDV
jgi:hypothetical protein